LSIYTKHNSYITYYEDDHRFTQTTFVVVLPTETGACGVGNPFPELDDEEEDNELLVDEVEDDVDELYELEDDDEEGD